MEQHLDHTNINFSVESIQGLPSDVRKKFLEAICEQFDLADEFIDIGLRHRTHDPDTENEPVAFPDVAAVKAHLARVPLDRWTASEIVRALKDGLDLSYRWIGAAVGSDFTNIRKMYNNPQHSPSKKIVGNLRNLFYEQIQLPQQKSDG